MTKNVIIIDEQGNQYGSTYPKRAKGLIKSGRARFVDNNTICLACPPKVNLEEHKMTENIPAVNNSQENISDTAVKTISAETPSIITAELLLKKLDEIQNNSGYLNQAFDTIEKIPQSSGADGESAGAKAAAVADIVRCRETTNQKLIELYSKMYDSIK